MMKGVIRMVILAVKIIFLALQGYVCMEIIGGHNVKPHSRPYMASIQEDGSHICGGALITSKWILTAAHCFLNRKQKHIKVLLGAHSLSKGNQKKQQLLTVKHFLPHKDWINHDIMLLKLSRDAVLNKYVSTLKLPKSTEDIKPNTKCSIAGWGITNRESTLPSDTLKEVNLITIDRKICNSKAYYNGKPLITEEMLCVGDKKYRKDSCLGDSGGPLICQIKFRKKVYCGILSGGGDCAHPNQPGIYTRLSKNNLHWINDQIRVTTQNMIMD